MHAARHPESFPMLAPAHLSLGDGGAQSMLLSMTGAMFPLNASAALVPPGEWDVGAGQSAVCLFFLLLLFLFLKLWQNIRSIIKFTMFIIFKGKLSTFPTIQL